jgi:hypothetical protein
MPADDSATDGFEVRNVVIAAAVLMAVALATFSVYVARAILRPPYSSPKSGKPLSPTAIAFSWGTEKTDPLHDFGLPFEDVEFQSVCGHTLRGWFIDRRQRRPGDRRSGDAPRSKDDIIVIFAHGGGRDRRAFLRHTPIVCTDGEYVRAFSQSSFVLCVCRPALRTPHNCTNRDYACALRNWLDGCLILREFQASGQPKCVVVVAVFAFIIVRRSSLSLLLSLFVHACCPGTARFCSISARTATVTWTTSA